MLEREVTRVAVGFNEVVGAEAKLDVPSHLGPLYEMSLGVGDATAAAAGFLKKLKTVDCFMAASRYESDNY